MPVVLLCTIWQSLAVRVLSAGKVCDQNGVGCEFKRSRKGDLGKKTCAWSLQSFEQECSILMNQEELVKYTFHSRVTWKCQFNKMLLQVIDMDCQ